MPLEAILAALKTNTRAGVRAKNSDPPITEGGRLVKNRPDCVPPL